MCSPGARGFAGISPASSRCAGSTLWRQYLKIRLGLLFAASSLLLVIAGCGGGSMGRLRFHHSIFPLSAVLCLLEYAMVLQWYASADLCQRAPENRALADQRVEILRTLQPSSWHRRTDSWRPNGWFSFVGNQYALGEDALGIPGRVRYHTDDSIQVKYYDKPGKLLDKMAFSLTGDMGCEHGGGVSCAGDSAKGPKQSFLGYMLYNRFWFHKDLYAVTLGGGQINNPGRYLVLLPPINGATAASGTPYFTENPGDPFKAWDVSATVDYMPVQYVTFRLEYNHRGASVPYFSGPGGVTPPGGNNGDPSSFVPGWTPDLVKNENRITGALLVMF